MKVKLSINLIFQIYNNNFNFGKNLDKRKTSLKEFNNLNDIGTFRN